MTKILLILLTLGLTSLGGFIWYIQREPDISSYDLRNADNWDLPSRKQEISNSGFYADKNDKFSPKAEDVQLKWKDISPKESVYDWSELKNRLDLAKKSNRGVWLRIYFTDEIMVPDWFKAKHPNIARIETGQYEENLTGNSPGRFYPLWHKDMESEIGKMMQDLAKQNIVEDPDFHFMYVPFGWRWNEWVCTAPGQMEKDGFTPESFLIWWESHLNIYTKAFENNVNKLVYTGSAAMDFCDGNLKWMSGLNDIKKGRNKMTDIALNMGLSVRLGDLEYFNNYSFFPSWGRFAKKIGNYYYPEIDPENPLIKDPSRIVGTENEGIGDDGMLLGTKNYYFVRQNTLKSLSLGVNWINLQQKTYDLAPDVFEYARKTMGQTIAQRDDVWVALRQWQDFSLVKFKGLGEENLHYDDKIPFRNWELGLRQRDLENGGKTRAVAQIGDDSSFPFFFQNGSSFEALKTDVSNNQNYFYFQVDSKFIQDDKNYKLAVTYLDDSNSLWSVDFYDKNGEIQQSQTVQNTNDKIWKTVFLDLPNIGFKQKFTDKMDFRLYNGGKEDLTVTFVRLVKQP